MEELYQIGVSLMLSDAMDAQLESAIDGFLQMQAAVDAVNASLGRTLEAVTAITGASSGMAAAWHQAAEAADRMSMAGNSMGGGSGGGSLLIPGGAGGGGAVPPIGGSDGPAYLPGPGGTPGVPALIPGQPYYSGDDGNTFYRSGYAPNWTNGSGGGSGTDAPFNDSNGPVPLYPGHGGGIDPAHIMSYIFTAGAGAHLVGAAASGLTSPSFDVQTQLTNIANMAPKGTDTFALGQQALAEARKLQQDPNLKGLTIGQALAMISNLYSVDRNMDAVTAIAGQYAMAGYVMQHAQGGGVANDQLYAILRSSEDLGLLNIKNPDGSINTQKAAAFASEYGQLVANSNGNITGAGALTMIAQAGPGGTQLDSEALERMILMSQSLTPSQIGTGMNALNQQLIGGKMSQATARSLHEAGVLPDYMFGPDGKILNQYKYGIGQVMLPPGTLKDEELALEDPIGYADKYLFGQYLNADGTVKQGDEKDVEGLIAGLNRSTSRIPAERVLGNSIFNAIQLSRQADNAAAMETVADLAAHDASTANAAKGGAGAAFNGFLAALGSPLIPGATKGLTLLTEGLNDLSNAATKHPDETGVFDISAIALAQWAALKGTSGVKFLGPFADAAGKAADAEKAFAGEVLSLTSRLAPWLAALSLSGDTAQPPPGTHWVPGFGGGKYAPNTPTGRAGDPLHVKIVNPVGAPSGYMPSGPTTNLPSQSRPAPGQVQLSP